MAEFNKMNKLQLVVETPRAGKWNHRFIVAQKCRLCESEVAKVIAAARRNPQGKNYLSVSTETAQSVSGRIGKEILVLEGIDVKKLSNTQRQQIIAQLEQRLTDLATLVTDKIDWEKAGKKIRVVRPELTEWEKEFTGLPTLTLPWEKNICWRTANGLTRLFWLGGVLAGIIAITIILLSF
jgi:hypothetical protein